jgi:hypothetical protein
MYAGQEMRNLIIGNIFRNSSDISARGRTGPE